MVIRKIDIRKLIIHFEISNNQLRIREEIKIIITNSSLPPEVEHFKLL